MLCASVGDCYVITVNPILHEEIAYIYVPIVTGTRLLPIPIHPYHTLVVLEYNVLFNLIPLCLHKETYQDVMWQVVTYMTTLASVELFVLNFCLLDLQCTIPYPNGILPSVWIFRSGCTPYEVSNHVHSWLRLSTPITLL